MAVPFVVLFAVAAVTGFVIFNNIKRMEAMEASLAKTAATLDLKVDEDLFTVEYGANLDRLSPVQESTGKVSYYGVVNTLEPGVYDITYRVSARDEYGQRAWKDFPRQFTVKDTRAPEISFESEV